MSATLNVSTTKQFIDSFWDKEILPALSEFISIPCKTPTLDSNWQQNGYLQQAAQLAERWIKAQNVAGVTVQILQASNRTPFVFADIPGTDKSNKTIMFYGHLDKMPETEGWNEGLGAWKPVIENDCLYGRGAVDDGYAAFAPIAAIKALQTQGVPHARCVMLLEASEECGSIDFDYYLKELESRIGIPDAIICIDAGGDNYEQLWCTTSLRGVISGNLRVEISTKGMHSGSTSGIIPSTFRIARQLLSRIEDEKTGEILIKDFYTNIPQERMQQVEELAKILGDKVYKEMPFLPGAQPVTTNIKELLLNKTWRPTLSVIGAEGLPLPKDAGNVLRPMTALQLSLRIPPQVDPAKLAAKVKETLEKDPPYGAKVTFTPGAWFFGWNAPQTASWLEQALTEASKNYFGDKPAYVGEGGSIGIIQMLGEKYPQAQFMVSGVSGPDSCAHGPNELLNIPAAKKFTCCVADVLAKHSAHNT